MKQSYSEQRLKVIAAHCDHFEHIISAMGYGYSLLNVSPKTFERRCDDCVHWADSSCTIFQDFIER